MPAIPQVENEISSNTKDTALTLAILKGHYEIAKYLLSLDLSKKFLERSNKDQQNALILTKTNNRDDLSNLINEKLASTPPIHSL